MTGQFSAGPSALGYKYQTRLALLLLFKAIRDNRTTDLSLERLDDIAFESGATAQELVQTKHHITPANLTDSSVDLWKTLRVWCEATATDSEGTNQAILTLLTTATAAEGSVASMLRPSGTRDVKVAQQRLQIVAEEAKNVALKLAYASYLKLDEKSRLALLSRVNVLDAQPNVVDIGEEIKKKYLIFSVRPNFVGDLFEALEGWWSLKSDALLLNTTMTIRASDLQNKLYELSHQYTDYNLPDDFPKPLEMDVTELPEHQRYFIAQLNLVLSNNSRLRRAIGTYYRAYHQRSKWLDRGLVTDDELERYEDYLVEEWTLEFDKILDEQGELPDEKILRQLGLNLFNWSERKDFRTIRKDYQNGMFARGSLHMLANSFKVGWHPDFKNRLAELMMKAAEAAS